jgi:hypothetical protein
MENNGEALLHDMINDGADEEDADYAQYDETQYDEALEGYSIDNQPLFATTASPMPWAKTAPKPWPRVSRKPQPRHWSHHLF